MCSCRPAVAVAHTAPTIAKSHFGLIPYKVLSFDAAATSYVLRGWWVQRVSMIRRPQLSLFPMPRTALSCTRSLLAVVAGDNACT